MEQESKPEEKPALSSTELLEISARLSKQLEEELRPFRTNINTKDRILKALTMAAGSLAYNDLPH